MRWKGRAESTNVEDRRGIPAGPALVGGGGIMLLVVIVALLFGADPQKLLGPMMRQQQQQPQFPGQADRGPRAVDPAQEELASFVRVILKDTETVWGRILPEQAGRRYIEPTLVLFSDRVESACGLAGKQTGPFYCPPDQKIYIDLTFFQELEDRLQAPGDFAQAYVIAHEIGHHVQKLLGVSDEVRRIQERASREEANELSVRLELQADFYAGLWAHHAQREFGSLEPGDIEEAIRCAQQIGDDRLQRSAQGYVVPELFTHGTSQQRMRWFVRGLKSGQMADGDTFNTNDL
jgi:hypothetical protein